MVEQNKLPSPHGRTEQASISTWYNRTSFPHHMVEQNKLPLPHGRTEQAYHMVEQNKLPLPHGKPEQASLTTW